MWTYGRVIALVLGIALAHAAAEGALTGVTNNNSLDGSDVYELRLGAQDNGERVNIDRTHTFGGLPVYMQGLDYIKTANDDKTAGAGFSVDVTFDVDTRFYLSIDNRINLASTMGWVTTQGWTDTGDDWAKGGDATHPFSVYTLDVAGTSHTFYEQNDGGSRNMYSISAKPAPAPPPPMDEFDLSIVNWSFEVDAAPVEGASGWTISPSDEYYTTVGTGLSAGDPDFGQEGPGSQFLTGNRLAMDPDDPSNPTSSHAEQSIDISARAGQIDAGVATLSLDFFYNRFDGNESNSVSVEFFDAGSNSLGSLTTGALGGTAADAWVPVNLSGPVPVNARTFLLQLDASRGSGTATNVSYDNFSAALLTPAAPIPEPMTMLAVGLGVAGLGGYVRKRRRS